MENSVPVAWPRKRSSAWATPPALVNRPAAWVWAKAKAVVITIRLAARTVMSDPSTVSTRS